MKNVILIYFALISSISFSQKIEFGLSYNLGINFTGKDQTIQLLNDIQAYPAQSHLIRPHSIWTTHQIQFDFYPTELKGFSASLGLRMFTFGWKTDSVSAGYASPITGEWMSFYARRESKFGYFMPTVHVGFQHDLNHSFSLNHSLSVGLFSFLRREKQYSYAYTESGEDVFEYIDEGYRHWAHGAYFETDVHDAQISSECVYSFKGLSLSVGPALYYLTSDFVDHLSFQVKAGAIYRFSRKEN